MVLELADSGLTRNQSSAIYVYVLSTNEVFQQHCSNLKTLTPVKLQKELLDLPLTVLSSSSKQVEVSRRENTSNNIFCLTQMQRISKQILPVCSATPDARELLFTIWNQDTPYKLSSRIQAHLRI